MPKGIACTSGRRYGGDSGGFRHILCISECHPVVLAALRKITPTINTQARTCIGWSWLCDQLCTVRSSDAAAVRLTKL